MATRNSQSEFPEIIDYNTRLFLGIPSPEFLVALFISVSDIIILVINKQFLHDKMSPHCTAT